METIELPSGVDPADQCCLCTCQGACELGLGLPKPAPGYMTWSDDTLSLRSEANLYKKGSEVDLNLSSFIVPWIKQSRGPPGACGGKCGQASSRVSAG